jgi:hypothetical protein
MHEPAPSRTVTSAVRRRKSAHLARATRRTRRRRRRRRRRLGRRRLFPAAPRGPHRACRLRRASRPVGASLPRRATPPARAVRRRLRLPAARGPPPGPPRPPPRLPLHCSPAARLPPQRPAPTGRSATQDDAGWPWPCPPCTPCHPPCWTLPLPRDELRRMPTCRSDEPRANEARHRLWSPAQRLAGRPFPAPPRAESRSCCG